MKRIIVLVGMPGSGKEEFTKIAEKRGFTVVRMGDTVRDETRKRGLELTDRNVGTVAHSEREKSGYGVWAVQTLTKINRGDEKNVIVDGCRGDAEVTIFKQNFSDLDVVAIFSSPETRYNRIRSRKRADSPFTLEEFYEREQRELKWGIGNAFIMADFMITNEGSLDDYRRDIEKALDKIISKK